ncbi:MAG: AsmA family protein, partial [Deltaproteobacteria bacterium]|nr:AsmA family protein [Deltaproteobacteria bacterium]
MKKPFKTTLIAIAASIGLVLAALAIVPLVLKDRVAKLVRSELNERLDAAVDFEAIDLSLLSTFPTLTVEVVDLSIAGKGVFEGTTLLSVQSLGAGVDLFSLIGDDELVVESIAIEHPEIHVVVTEDGVANYDIVKESAEESEELEPEEEADTADIVLQLRHYRIIDGAITYEAPGTHVLIDELHHDGSATITGAAQTLASKTTIGELSVKLGRVTYLKKAKVEVAIATTLRTDARHIDLEELSIAVNELSVAGSGDIGWTDDALDLDVEVASAKGQSLKALVSAVPNAYAADFAGLRASGNFSLDAKVKGQLGPDDDDIPSFAVRLLVHDGTLKYPDLPLPLTNVALDAKATHPGGNLDKVRIDVAKYAARAGESHASGRLAVTTPISQPDVALALEGRFDMAEIADAYPIPDVEDLRGVITATLDLAAKGDDIKRLRGDIRATDIVYRAKDAPPVKVEEAHVVLSPRATKVEAFRANLGRSDVALSGSLSPFTAFLSDDETIVGNLQLKSRAIYVDDFLSDEGDKQAGQETTPFLLPDHVNAKLAVDVGKLTYGDLVLSNFKGAARVRRRKLTLSGVRADALGGSMKLSGTVATPVGKPATFEMDYEVDKVRFAEAFEALPSMRAYAPIARFLDGRFSTLGDDGEPKLRSIDANGLVMTLQSKLRADFKPLAVLHDAVPAIPKPLDLSSLKARFNIEDGAVRMKPFEVKTKGLQLLVSGSHGLDQEMSYRVSTDLPIDKVTGALAKKVRGLGLDLSKASDVDVAAKLTGSIQHPRVSVDVDTDALRGAVAETISAELEARRQQALAAVVAQNQKIMAEATKRAAQVRTEG